MPIKDFIFELIDFYIRVTPNNQFFNKLRCNYFKKRLKFGSNPQTIGYLTEISTPDHVFIGESFIRPFVIISPEPSEIFIGNNCMVAPFVMIRAGEHDFSRTDIPIHQQGFVGRPIVIEDDCLISSHVTITAGVRIGKGSIIGANSVVTKDIPPYSIAFGCPAEVYKCRL